MVHIKKFLDKISVQETKNSKDVVMPISEARGLRDEIAKLLSDLHTLSKEKESEEEIIKVEIKGSKFK